jgi:hypothetical protein
VNPEEYSACIGYALKPAKDSTGRFSASEEVVIGPDGWSAATSCAGDDFAKDIAARLNGPSPAEVAALLREVESSGRDVCSNAICPSCGADFDIQVGGRAPGEHFPECKLSAMIKQCEGA